MCKMRDENLVVLGLCRLLRTWSRTVVLASAVVGAMPTDALSSVPLRFFVGIETILIQVGSDPYDQSLFIKEELARSVRQLLREELRDFGNKMSIDVASLNDDRVSAPRTLTVAIHVSVRQAPPSLSAPGSHLLAASITLMRFDLPIPAAIPPRFLIPAEPLLIQSGTTDVVTQLLPIVRMQLRRGVVEPLTRSNVRGN